jgi:outer membrane protein TolC
MLTRMLTCIAVGLTLCITVGQGASAHAQPAGSDASASADTVSVIDAYVQRALASNHALQQEHLDLERSFAALRHARGAFLPSVDLEARYSVADGGRTIDVPAGDLLNPVYATLNELTGEQRFSPTGNVSDPFLRDREQETQFRLEQPIFVPRILHNYRANKEHVAAQQAAVEALKQEVTRDVKVAYFNYLQAQRGVDVLRATEALTEENLRTNRRLLQRTRVTRDVVLRAKADMLEIRQRRIEAEKDRNLARSYLNFLMNRPLETPIRKPDGFERSLVPSETPSTTDVVQTALNQAGEGQLWTSLQKAATNDLQRLQDQAVAARPELRQVSRSIQAAEQGINAAQANYWPEVVLALDAGIQGETYRFTGDAPFYMGSIVLRWNVFNGFQDQARVEQARLQKERLASRHDELRQQIRLEVQESQERVQVVRTSLAAATERAQAAREGFRLTRRRHEEGVSNQVSLVDARTTLTDAELNLSSTRYEYLKRLAQLEYAVGTARPYAAAMGADARPSMRRSAPDADAPREGTARSVTPDTTNDERFGLRPSAGSQ